MIPCLGPAAAGGTAWDYGRPRPGRVEPRGSDPPRLPPNSILLAEQPTADVPRHLLEPFVADLLAVEVGNVGCGVPHDPTHGEEISGFVADRLEGVPQRIKIPVPVDAQRVKQL